MRISEPPTKPFELKNVELKIKNIIKVPKVLKCFFDFLQDQVSV